MLKFELLSATKYNQLKQSRYIEIVVNSFNGETASFELKFCKAYLAGPRINLLCIPIKFICRIAAETKMLIRSTNLEQLCTHLFILL